MNQRQYRKRRPQLTRQDLLFDKNLTRELALKFAEVKSRLLEPEDTAASGDLDPGGTKASLRGIRKGQDGPTRQGKEEPISFWDVGRKVANIIKFRQAVQRRRSDQISQTGSTTQILPRLPRFSSYMSAEAQYALMQGYEDAIFDKLSSSFPGQTGSLIRNKTPHHRVVIANRPDTRVDINVDSENESEFGFQESLPHINKREDDHNSNRPIPLRRSQEGEDMNKHLLTSLEAANFVPIDHYENEDMGSEHTNSSSEEEYQNETHTLPSLRFLQPRQSSRPKISSWNNLQTCDSSWNVVLPAISQRKSHKRLLRDRRIWMSHRMEAAMDILDSLKPDSECRLSPRVRAGCRSRVAPLVDFSRWTKQWTHEFHIGIEDHKS